MEYWNSALGLAISSAAMNQETKIKVLVCNPRAMASVPWHPYARREQKSDSHQRRITLQQAGKRVGYVVESVCHEVFEEDKVG
jgi:hypothetical protein